MGESVCLTQPFSYAAGIPYEANEGNPIQSLGQSISFGRFASEPLAWEKWSTFSHNRYVEEAERYSRPGSVAQKKAFFEAHYKNLAARKAAAAALMEQENAASNNAPKEEPEVEVNNITTNDSLMMTTLNSQVAVDEKQEAKLLDNEVSFAVDANGSNLNAEVERMKGRTLEGTDPLENDANIQLGVADNNEDIKEMNCREMKQMEKPLLKNFKSRPDSLVSTSDRRPALSSSKSSNYSKLSRVPSSPAQTNIPIRPKKENIATPISKKSAIDYTDKKRFTPPKSSHKSISFTPVRALNKFTTSRIDGSKMSSYSKPSKDCSTPLKTPTTASIRRQSKNPLATPQSEKRRTRENLNSSASERKTVRSKWNFLPTECSKFLGSSKNTLQSPSFSTPFSLRTEERAAIRKKKLEENFNASHAQRLQQQTTLKEKAETELRRLRQSLCFKARPLPDFYKHRGTSKNQMKKVLLAHPESPKLGKQFTPRRVHGNTSEPLPRPSIKSKSPSFENNQIRTSSLTSQQIAFSHENMSPNIQQKCSM